LPPELQSYTVFHAGVGVGSKELVGGKALIEFLTTRPPRRVQGEGAGGGLDRGAGRVESRTLKGEAMESFWRDFGRNMLAASKLAAFMRVSRRGHPPVVVAARRLDRFRPARDICRTLRASPDRAVQRVQLPGVISTCL